MEGHAEGSVGKRDNTMNDIEKDETIEQIEASPAPEKTKKEKAKEELKEWFKDILFAVVVAFLVTQVVMPTVVKQHSMENTLMEDDYIFVGKKAYKWFGEPERGDIVIFDTDLSSEGNGRNKMLVKRIIGLPGDTIAIHDGKVYLNGSEFKEEYIKDGLTNGDIDEEVIPEDCYFCMGDNRLVSRDSRDPSVGLVSFDAIKGKVLFRLLPLKKFGSVYK